MPTLIIDDRKIEVAQGTRVIDAAEKAGIMIPRFCYHPALGSAGACRMCAVKFLDGPVSGLQMSCMVEAKDEMVVSTADSEAVDFRRFVIELLMLNHPHDCPVCDEGGHCLLQDETTSSGHVMRRYLGKKRTFRNQYLGELIRHEMNRCIHCYRCRRFYQDYSGYHDFGAMGTANRTYFGRFSDGSLESPFSGNLIDLCPTGVLTDKKARFKARRWDFERAPSICIQCSLGCNTVVSSRYREVVRIEARHNGAVNGYFICDRGRFGFSFANNPERPRNARIGCTSSAYDDALKAAASKLMDISKKSGSQAIVCMTSTIASVETHDSLKDISRTQGWQNPGFFMDRFQQSKITSAVERLNKDVAISMKAVENADFILVIGSDPVNEAPMLALAMRQASRKGAKIVILDPRPVFLSFEFEHLLLAPENIDSALIELIKNVTEKNKLETIGELLQKSLNPAIICGTEITGLSTVNLAADLAVLLKSEGKNAGLFYVMQGANAFGAALSAAGSMPFSEILEEIDKGEIKALVLVEASSPYDFSDQELVKNALKKLELLVVFDYMPGYILEMAHIAVPTLTHFETSASFINQEGRLQRTYPSYQAGTPLSHLTSGKHPPRKFRKDIPGSGARVAWEVISDLEAAMTKTNSPNT